MTDWNEIIRRQGEAANKRQEVLLETIRSGMEEQKQLMHALSHSELIDTLLEFHSRLGCYDPRERRLWSELVEYGKDHILSRMR